MKKFFLLGLLVLISVNVFAVAVSPFFCYDIESSGTGIRWTNIAYKSNTEQGILHVDGSSAVRFCNGVFDSWSCVDVGGPTAFTDNKNSLIYADSNYSLAYGNDGINFCTGNPGAFVCEKITAGPLDYGPSIIKETDGNFHTVFGNLTGTIDLKYCTGVSGNWNCEILDTDIDGFNDQDLDINVNGEINIVYTQDENLNYCFGNLGSFSCENVLIGENHDFHPTILIGSDQNVHIAAFDGTVDVNALLHCEGSTGNFNCETVTNFIVPLFSGYGDAVVGQIAETSDGNFHINYSNDGNMAECFGDVGNWTCRNVDIGGVNLGIYADMATAENNLFMSHLDGGSDEIRFCTNLIGLDSNFSYSLSNPYLDPESGISSLTIDLNDLSINAVGGDVNSWAWYVDSSLISTDQNTTYIATVPDDLNISLIVKDTNNLISQIDQNVLIKQAAQNIDINFTYRSFVNDVNVSFGVSTDSNINYAVWGGTDFDSNKTGVNIDFNYSTGGLKQVCVILNTAPDMNALYCENFTATRFLVHVPQDSDTFVSLSPFSITTSTPSQSYTAQVADLNVFSFFQSSQSFYLIADYNSDYYPRTYSYDLTSTDYFIEVQPYLDSTASSALVTITVIDGLTNNPLPDYRIDLFIVVSSVETLAESEVTDGAGITIFSMLLGEIYTAKLYGPDGVFIDSKSISPASTNYLWKINVNVKDINVSSAVFNVDFSPKESFIEYNSTSQVRRLIETISSDSTQTSSNVKVLVDGFSIFDANYSSDGNRSQDINFSSYSNNSIVTVRVVITNSERSQLFEKVYILKDTDNYDIIAAARNVKNNFGDFGALLLALFFSIVIAGFVAYFVGFDTTVLGFVLILVMGLFAFIGWVEVLIYVFACLTVFTSSILRGFFR